MRKGQYFFQLWAPELPEERVTASLAIEDGRSPKVAIVAWGEHKPQFLNQDVVPLLHGDGPDRITLVQCRNAGRNIFPGMAPDVTEIDPRTLYTGVHLNSTNPEIRSIEFSTKGLNAWFTERSVHFHTEGAEGEHYVVRPPGSRFVHLPNGLSLEIKTGVNVTSRFLDEEELSVRRKPWLRLRFAQLTPIEEALRSVHKTIGLLEFLADGSLDIDEVYVYPDEHGEPYEMLASWIKGLHPPHGGHSLVWFEAVKDNWQTPVEAWWNLYDKIPFALDSYRACHRRSGSTLELRYLAIVGALEAFHRAFYDRRKINLQERLEELSDRHSDVLFYLLPKADARRIVQTRDHIAHQTVFPNTSLIPVEHRWAWFRRLVAAFELCVVSHLNFSTEQLEGITRLRKGAIESGFMGEWDFTV